jgi:hypothetical protein
MAATRDHPKLENWMLSYIVVQYGRTRRVLGYHSGYAIIVRLAYSTWCTKVLYFVERRSYGHRCRSRTQHRWVSDVAIHKDCLRVCVRGPASLMIVLYSVLQMDYFWPQTSGLDPGKNRGFDKLGIESSCF